MSLQVGAPVSGRAIPLAAVPDVVFAQAMVGPGAAIDPRRLPADALAPIDGHLLKLHPHAFVVVSAGGHGVLVHLGIDTVQLDGAGFTLLGREGETVRAGQPLVRWDPAAVAETGRSPVCPVIALDARPEAVTALLDSGEVTAGSAIFTWV
jgi:PTS system glucose-specific IIA component